ncbi:MAG: hypothetical protein AVDCRST_MAG41-636 [uncultured Corynebacteriales bacterium]|uniref:Type II secretion system protein GspF domain-containing protein n=1 Tax=uncultured Mycobacteriales bacterium TaxID=581187 RepID=A0A6J4HIU3_9ACTN|nr:MAG: hypothetical protein AVDCRST_MAG41-636 [uncultured Corynebacteriales bacterium]
MTGGVPATLLALAIVLLRAPSPVAARLRMLHDRASARRFEWRWRPTTAVGVVAPAVLGAGVLAAWSIIAFGTTVPVLPAVAGAVAGATAASVLTAAARGRQRRRAAAALVESVGQLAADLRAGARPGDAVAALAEDPASIPAIRHRAVQAVWAVAATSGAPAASVLERVEHDLRARERHRREVAAQLAGARSTGGLLAILPIVGMGMGSAMGAEPLSMLLGRPAGQLALLAGVGLEAAGVLWTARIVAGAERAP